MRILSAATTYAPVVERIYSGNPGLAEESYAVQRALHEADAMGMAAGLAAGFEALGHDVWLVFPENLPQQRSWARENRLEAGFAQLEAEGLRTNPSRSAVWGIGPWTWPCLMEQIRAVEPDLIFSDNLIALGGFVLKEVQGAFGKAVGFHCSPMFPNVDHHALVAGFDLLLAGSIPVRDWYGELGIDMSLMRYGFDTRLLDRLPSATKPRYGISFVGQVGPKHYRKRTLLLEFLCRNLDVALFASQMSSIARAPGLQARQRDEVWGRSAFEVMQRSQITLNSHEDGAGSYIGNMRLFEATGLGCCLLTDRKDDLQDVFECTDPAGLEVLTYDSPEECLEIAQAYLERPEACADIGRRAQARVLKEHTYVHRAEHLLALLGMT